MPCSTIAGSGFCSPWLKERVKTSTFWNAEKNDAAFHAIHSSVGRRPRHRGSLSSRRPSCPVPVHPAGAGSCRLAVRLPTRVRRSAARAANRGRGQRRVENRARVAPSSSARRGSWKVRSRSAATWSERASSLTLPVEPAPTCAVAPSGCDGRQVAVPVCRGPPGLAGRRSSSWPPADGHRQAG